MLYSTLHIYFHKKFKSYFAIKVKLQANHKFNSKIAKIETSYTKL